MTEQRHWDDLTSDEQERITRLLRVDPSDDLDDVIARCERAIEILRAPADSGSSQ